MIAKSSEDECKESTRRTAGAWAPGAVLFDFDGTLTRPGILDFAAIRQAIGCPPGETILEFINALPPGNHRKSCLDILESFEAEAARRAEPNAGAEDIVRHLKSRGIPSGILTRNTLAAVTSSLRNFTSLSQSDFTAIITRDDPGRPKPEPDGVLLAACRMGLTPDRLLVVGDYIFDIEAGRKAGAKTAFLCNDKTDCSAHGADFSLSHLSDLMAIF